MRRTIRVLYFEAGTKGTKAVVYSINYDANAAAPLSRSDTYVRTDDVCQLRSILGHDNLDKLAKQFQTTYHQVFVDKAVLGLTAWARRKPQDPQIEAFCKILNGMGISCQFVSGEEQAQYQHIAAIFAAKWAGLDNFKAHCSSDEETLQVSNGKAHASMPIAVREWTRKIAENDTELVNFVRYVGDLDMPAIKVESQECGLVLPMGSFDYMACLLGLDNDVEGTDIKVSMAELHHMLAAYSQTMVEKITSLHHDIQTKEDVERKKIAQNYLAEYVKHFVMFRINWRALANLALGNTQVLFKRDWDIRGSTFRTTWSFGHFLSLIE